ncbi:hypothetical protein OBV_38410 [Oscillibacter valericigenes Sjm18-20]|nr:hypothetical protein OBV_38410 [Oscillibacter valericigenes Sjm18-20]
MKHLKYGEFIADTVQNMPFAAAIPTEVIANQLAERFILSYDQARKLTNVKLKRMADRGEIERFQKGMYFHVKETVFGKATPDIDKMVMKTLTEQDGEKIGYESGASLFNKLGLTTMIPRDIEITTNRYRTNLPERCHIKVRRPPTVITDQNWKCLQLIDVVSALPNAHIDSDHPEQLLAAHIKKQQLDGLTLILTTRRYYPQKVVLRVIDLLELINTPGEIDAL